MQRPDEETIALICEGLSEARRYLPVLVNGIGETAKLLQKGDLATGEAQLVMCLEGVYWMLDFVSKAQYLASAGLSSTNDITDLLQTQLTALRHAADNHDLVAMVDILEYELMPLIQQCGAALTAIHSMIQDIQ